MFETSAGCVEGKLRIFQCVQVPRSFHALFSATWRRYIYAFPLRTKPADETREKFSAGTKWFPAVVYPLAGESNITTTASVDVDCAYINEALSRLVGRSLHYNAYATGEHLHGGEPDPKDLCILHKAHCRVVDISEFHRLIDPQSPACTEEVKESALSSSMGEGATVRHALFVELVGNRFLRKMVRRLTATAIRESIKADEFKDVEALVKIGESRNR
jgi:tRNA U38,U39,U40 pseudouridine synthase TruA